MENKIVNVRILYKAGNEDEIVKSMSHEEIIQIKENVRYIGSNSLFIIEDSSSGIHYIKLSEVARVSINTY